MLMSPDAQRTRKARLLRSQCASTWMLTGTPMPGNPDNLWGVLSTLGVAGECFEGWEEFVELCGGKKKYVRVKGELRNVGYTWKGISPVVRERMIAGPMLRRTTKEVLPDLPSLQRVDVPVEAPESLTEFLDKVKSEWDEVGPNDLPPFELISEAMAALARSKMRAAVEFVNNAASLDFPLLVFSAHVDPVIAIGALKGAGFFVGPTPTEERNALIKKFQAGKLRILAMSIGTGGVGLNLQRAAGVVFVDRSYTPTDNWQAEKRAHRPGQERDRVMCWRLISRHALDQRLSEILDEKETNIQVAVG
jgi:SNF2 family DNA or RNA helicase